MNTKHIISNTINREAGRAHYHLIPSNYFFFFYQLFCIVSKILDEPEYRKNVIIIKTSSSKMMTTMMMMISSNNHNIKRKLFPKIPKKMRETWTKLIKPPPFFTVSS